jgi:hypothetical protein
MTQTEQVWDAFSTVNGDGVPHLGTCTLIVGDGTMKVDFNNGRAKVPGSFAHLVARHPQIEIPGYSSDEPDEPGIEGDEPVEKALDYQSLPVAALKALANERGLKVSGKVTKPKLVAALEQGDEPKVDRSRDPQEVSAEVKAAMEHLAAEGEEVPDVEPSGPEDEVAKAREGFEATTADGQARCQAAKADGGQCANSALEESRACRLPKHQEQLA